MGDPQSAPEITMGDSSFDESLTSLFEEGEPSVEGRLPQEGEDLLLEESSDVPVDPDAALPPPAEDTQVPQGPQVPQQALDEAYARVAAAEQALASRDWEMATTDLSRTKSDIVAKQEDLAEAIDEGDSKGQSRLQGEINSLQNRQRDIEGYLNASRSAPRVPQQMSPQEQIQPTQVQYHTAAQDPIGAAHAQVNSWTNDPRYKEDARRLYTVAQSLVAEGYVQTSQEFYDILHERFDRTNPGLFRRPTGSPSTSHRPGRQSMNPNAAGDVTTAGPTKKLKTLTRRDREVMVEWGLSPSNKQHVSEFLLNRNEADRNASQRRTR